MLFGHVIERDREVGADICQQVVMASHCQEFSGECLVAPDPIGMAALQLADLGLGRDRIGPGRLGFSLRCA